MTRRILTGILLIIMASLLGAESREVGSPEIRAERLVQEFRDSMYQHHHSDEVMRQAQRILSADLGDLGLESQERIYWDSLSLYYLGRAYQSLDTVEAVLEQDSDVRGGKFKRIQTSIPELSATVDAYERSLSGMETYLEKERDSRGVWLYAQALSQLSTLKSLGYLLGNGTRIQPLAEEALELDATNVKAALLLASRFIYSPGIWGGNPDKGIAMLEELRGRGDKEDEHNIEIGTGFAHTMAKRWNQALPHFRNALEIYPGNVYALAMITLCEQEIARQK